jgi:hypothetical protein
MVKYLNWVNGRLTLENAVVTSTGAADGDKILALNNQGYIDPFAMRDRTFQRRRAEYSCDFIEGLGGLTSSVAGTGASNSLIAFIPPAYSAGWVQHNTGTTATGRAAIGNANSVFRLGVCPFLFRGIFYIPTASNATESFVYRLGWIDNASAESVDGIFLRISASNVSQFVCRNNNIETVVNLNTNFATASVWGVVISIDEAATVATLKVYDHTNDLYMGPNELVETATITTNIPVGSTRLVGFGSYLQKTLGTAARVVDLDFIYAGIDF